MSEWVSEWLAKGSGVISMLHFVMIGEKTTILSYPILFIYIYTFTLSNRYILTMYSLIYLAQTIIEKYYMYSKDF